MIEVKFSEPHTIAPNDTRSWMDLYRENQLLIKTLEEIKHQNADYGCEYCYGPELAAEVLEKVK